MSTSFENSFPENAPAESVSPETLAADADAARDEVDRTLGALEERLSVRRRLDTAMNSLSPRITTMIRMDHTHVLAAFRRYRSYLSLGRKRALVANVCLALEIHAQLEEEIFYPALRDVAGTTEALDKSVPEHDEMRALIDSLRHMEPDDAQFDDTFRALIRAVLHHVADEETILLPLAEDTLGDELGRLGWEMTRRRMELLKPHIAEVASTTMRTFPVGSAAVIGGALALVWLVLRGGDRAQ